MWVRKVKEKSADGTEDWKSADDRPRVPEDCGMAWGQEVMGARPELHESMSQCIKDDLEDLDSWR